VRFLRYFTDLGFLWTKTNYGSGRGSVQSKRTELTIAAYIFFSLGLFGRQITAFPKVRIAFENINWSVAIASFVIGLAVFPLVMNRLNKARPRPSFEHMLIAFSMGFFVDLSNEKLLAPLLSKLF
jgi:hypothetical protein